MLNSVKFNLLDIGLNGDLRNSGKGGELLDGDELVLLLLVCPSNFVEQQPSVTLALARY